MCNKDNAILKFLAVLCSALILCGCADGRHELQNTDTGGGIGYCNLITQWRNTENIVC